MQIQRSKMGEQARVSRQSLTEDDKWVVALSRNGDFDGAFVFAVRSTGVYCRPSCPAKRPNRKQVIFFSGFEEAERSGFRSCRRCHPREVTSPRTELIGSICDFIETNLEKKLTLSAISAHAGISPFHLQRTFKRAVGISPRQYIEARRLEKMKSSLRNGKTVTRALYDAGFNSRSRIYGKVQNKLGVSAGIYRRGGTGMRIEYAITSCPTGRLLIGAIDSGICAVCLGESDHAVEAAITRDYPFAVITRNDNDLTPWIECFRKYFKGEDFCRDLPIDVQATSFQWRVWKQIQAVPRGSTTTYGNIARAIGMPDSFRAVARACAANPVSLIIACHRVIGQDGSLRGYRWGKNRKRELLSLERTINDSNVDG
jgi:AraC family transcriptional regulator of adaptative response/methylated-DNA-[protein]-cysteine methyltransferase